MLRKEIWVINMILLIYFLKHIIMKSSIDDANPRKSDKEEYVD